MLLCWALLSASHLFSPTTAFDRIALPRRYLNTTVSASSYSLPAITWSIPPSSMTLGGPLPLPSTVTSSSGQSSSVDTSSNTSVFLPSIHTLLLPNTTSTTSTIGCTPLAPGQPMIVYIILPNPVTVTQTIGANYTSTFPPKVPEFTPPIFCPIPESALPAPSAPAPFTSSVVTFVLPSRPSYSPKKGPSTRIVSTEPITATIGMPLASSSDEQITTIITTSKNPVTVYTTASPPLYPGGEGVTNKHTVDPGMDRGLQGDVNTFPTDSPRVGDVSAGQVHNPIITTIKGHPIELQPSYVVIGGTTHSYGVFVETGAGSIVAPSTSGLGGDVTAAVISSEDNATPFSTNVLVLGGGVLTAIGSTIVVLDGNTVVYGPSSTFTTEFHRETITLGARISFDGTTIGGAANPGTRVGIAGGISVTQVGQSVAVISSTSLTIGPQAVITTVYIDTYTVIANSDGLEAYGTTLSYPFNPISTTLTFEGITFTKIGSTIIVVGGSTYTIGSTSIPQPPSSLKTTSYSRQTISINSKASGSPTISRDSASPAETSKKSDSNALKLAHFSLHICFWVSIYILL